MLLRKHYAAVFVLTIFLQFTCQVTKPFGVMVSSPDQTPQVPFMFFLIIHYFERPAPSARLEHILSIFGIFSKKVLTN